MNTPNILYYARMVNSTATGMKTPKYTIVASAGYYQPMEHLQGRDGLISFNLMEKLKEGSNVPSVRLQGKNSLNFTGLKEWFIDGKLSGYAYGYPYDQPTYSTRNRPNPFYEHRDDGYLFLVEADQTDPANVIPTAIEFIVLERSKVLVSAYCKQLVMGGFDEALKLLRQQAG